MGSFANTLQQFIDAMGRYDFEPVFCNFCSILHISAPEIRGGSKWPRNTFVDTTVTSPSEVDDREDFVAATALRMRCEEVMMHLKA